MKYRTCHPGKSRDRVPLIRKVPAFAGMTALLLLLASPSFAQEEQESFCVTYRQPESVAYQPGVDVHGNPVVSADLNDKSYFMKDVVRIPLNIDLAQRFDRDWAPGTDMDAEIGIIEIYRDGRVMFNDRDVTEEAIAFCESEETEATIIVTDTPEETIISGEGY